MRIPMGNMGNAIAAPEQQAKFSGRDPIGQALGGLAQSIGGAVETMQQAELQKQRSQAAMTAATLSNDLHDIHDQIGRDVTEGKLPAEQAVPEFESRMGKLKGERTKDLTNDQRMVIDEHLVKPAGALQRNLNGIAIARTQSETGANIMGIGEQLGRAAQRDLNGSIEQYKTVVDTMGPSAGWSPEQIAKQKQAFVEQSTYNFHDSALEGAAQTGKLDLVTSVREQIQGDAGEPLDPARRTALITKAYGIENGIKASTIRDQERQLREQEAKENKAFDAFKEADNMVQDGRYMSTEFISNLSTVTAGTKMAPVVQELVKSQAKYAGFASYPVAQQKAEIERLRAQGSTQGVGSSPDQEKYIARLQSIADATEKGYTENPWKTAQEHGVIKRAPEIALTDMSTTMTVLQARMGQIGGIEAAAGRKVSPLQPQEAEQIGRLVKSMPPDQQSAALASFGKMIGDGDRLADFARQIDSKDRVLATAMMVGDLQTTQGRYTAELIIKGNRALKDKSIMVDNAKETGWKGAIAKEIGDAFPNQEVRDRTIEAAYLVQAGFASEGGGEDVKRAIRLVSGPIVERNGVKIPVPRGMEESDFDKRIRSVTPATLSGQAPGGQVFVGKTAVQLADFVKTIPDAKLVSAGPGKYNVRAGMGLVVNAKGQRITIEVGNGH